MGTSASAVSPVPRHRKQFGWVDAHGADADNGPLYMRQRWYDPTLQRFISRDPIGLRGGRNLYSYVGNNPSVFVDPSGLDAFLWIRVQRTGPTDLNDWGHAWVEVDQPSGKRFSAGVYPQPDLFRRNDTESPEPYSLQTEKVPRDKLEEGFEIELRGPDGTIDRLRLVRRYRQCPDKDRSFVDFLKTQLKGRLKYVWPLEGEGSKRYLNVYRTRVCTTCAERWLRYSGVDSEIPVTIIQPNDLWNFFHPGKPLPAGPLKIPYPPEFDGRR